MLESRQSKILAIGFGILAFAWSVTYLQEWVDIESVYAGVILIGIIAFGYLAIHRSDKKYNMTDVLSKIQGLIDKTRTSDLGSDTQMNWGYLRGWKGKAWAFQLKNRGENMRIDVDQRNSEPVAFAIDPEEEGAPFLRNKEIDYSPDYLNVDDSVRRSLDKMRKEQEE